MATRLRDGGFAETDIHVPAEERKKNLVVRLHGTGKRKPICSRHLDVVEARREDWTTDPSKSSSKVITSTAAAPKT